nr:hypothetical protein [Tanacetum cinerariifolium]
MLLLLVQGKLSNLTVDERFAFNVSLRMFTRRIVIQRRVEDLQLGVESYQKRLNLTKPDTDGTLNDVRNALDDRLKGIRMQYLPTTIWRRGDKDRAAAMIQAIEKMLKTRRIMRSLKKFVGGRLRVKKLEKKQRSRTHNFKRLYKVGLTVRVDSSEDEQTDAEVFDVNDLRGEEVFVEKEVADKEVSAAGEVNVASITTSVSAAATITTEEITLAQDL